MFFGAQAFSERAFASDFTPNALAVLTGSQLTTNVGNVTTTAGANTAVTGNAFTLANGIWVLVGVLWKERSLIVLNAGLTIIYIIGLIENAIA